VAQADQIYIGTGVVQPEEVAMSRFSGDGVNISDMHIETKPREKFLKEYAKVEPNTETDPALGGTPEQPEADPKKLNGSDPAGKDNAAKH
jgi:hypothetical protein